MRTSPTSVPSGLAAACPPPGEARTPVRWGGLEPLRRPARASTLVALAIGLAVMISGCDRSSGSVAVGELVDGAASVAVVEEASAAELTTVPADPEGQITIDSLAPMALEDGRGEPANAATLAAGDEEMSTDPRAQLSDRTGARPTESAPELVTEGDPDVVAVSDKLAGARERLAPELAALSVAIAVARPSPKKPVVQAVAPARAAAQRAAATPRPAVRPATTSVAGLGTRVVAVAMRYLGYRYRYGGASPSTGFDCRGFTYWVYLRAGRPIPTTLSGQYATGQRVSRSGLRPGDLVFFKNTYKAGLSHAGIYIGNGRMINAQSESTGVVTASIDSSYWRPRFLGGRRP